MKKMILAAALAAASACAPVMAGEVKPAPCVKHTGSHLVVCEVVKGACRVGGK